MSGARIGYVTHYYDHIQVAVLALDEPLRIGDWLHIAGHTTNFVQPVVSLQVDHRAVPEAGPGQDVALKLTQRVREHDVIFRITADEARELEESRSLDLSW